jgi:hypothetical protein
MGSAGNPDWYFAQIPTRRAAMEDKPYKFYDDDGAEINPDIISKPTLCVSCKNDDDPTQAPLCILTRLDQQDEDGFECHAFEAKDT